jgi:hypothetical protein
MLCKQLVPLEAVLDGPSPDATAHGINEIFLAPNDESFVDDALLPQEADVISGVWLVEVPNGNGPRQTSYPSHWIR